MSLSVLSGCIQYDSLHEVENLHNQKFFGTPHQVGDVFEHQMPPIEIFSTSINCTEFQYAGASLNYKADEPILLESPFQTPITPFDKQRHNALPLSPGDMIELSMEYGDGFNGNYVVNNSGYLMIPVIGAIAAAGAPPEIIAERIELGLVRAEVFQPTTASVTVKVLHWSEIEVPVTGAVFQPGRVRINTRKANSDVPARVTANGDYASKRLLSEAVRAASGVRPDAKLDQIILIRRGWQIEVDLSGILTGQPVRDYPLIAGDQIIVPSTGCFQPNLVRPSQITPKGFRVFMSNLIDSAQSNASAAVGRYSTNIPYGTRLLQAAVSANCVGGKEWTNAPRKIVLSSTNPITGKTQVIERSIEQLMRMSFRDEINPYLMPNDAVACYDSDVTNLRDIAATIVDVLKPLTLF
ncbi:polysaccharide biosynthesis/export family protein [Marinibactrum halimedae]|nr:polysaccharide biosynthesis/export family protein [Marinibactrum halimedae]MCD9460687.1 polysaccharide biosynthesis/export family protein [Marinibactrum halimedae]